MNLVVLSTDPPRHTECNLCDTKEEGGWEKRRKGGGTGRREGGGGGGGGGGVYRGTWINSQGNRCWK